MKWSPQQVQALDAVAEWLRGGTQPFFFVAGHAGCGKALAFDAMVQTPTGPRRISDLAIGDEVVGADGGFVRVEGVYPQGERQAYRVTFRDKFSVECDLDHLWSVASPRGTRSILTTREMLQRGTQWAGGYYKFRVPLCEPVRYPTKDLPLAPYIIGALIGDGTGMGASPTLCMPDDKGEILARVGELLPPWAVLTTTRQAHCNYHRITDPRHCHQNGVKDILVGLGLGVNSPERAIPQEYLLGDVEQRTELLRGLMDTDGCCKSNRTSFSTSSKQLAEDICALVQSLGGTAILAGYARRRTGKTEYHVNVKTFFCPFHLGRKAQRWSPPHKSPPSRSVISIEPSRICEHVCIKVSAADGLFLTDHYIVTHNTVLAKHFAELADGMVLFAAFTGKAAAVLRSKGCYNATTIHRLIYEHRAKSTATLRELQAELAAETSAAKKSALRIQIRKEVELLKQPAFQLNPDSVVRDASLIIVDEVSMVDRQMGTDLLSFGVPVLVLGDPAQLPPIAGKGYFTEGRPDVMLTEIHRQGELSGILQLATSIRKGTVPDYCDLGDAKVIRVEDLDPNDVPGYDQVIVGRNVTRHATNQRIRGLLEHSSPFPEKGERLVCLRNNHDLGVLNGEIYTATSAAQVASCDTISMCIPELIECYQAPFLGEKLENWSSNRDIQEFDYGYALTCNKAQGSGFPAVLVFDESHYFRAHAMRWLYTAVTRASERLTLVR